MNANVSFYANADYQLAVGDTDGGRRDGVRGAVPFGTPRTVNSLCTTIFSVAIDNSSAAAMVAGTADR